MTEQVKIFEEKKKLPIWAWLVPLLLLIGVLGYFLTRHREPAISQAPVSQVAPANAFPDLGTVHFDTDQATLTPASQAVANYLKGKGIDGSRLTGNGFGPGNPADTNATGEGKADNRRVELFSQQ